MTRAPLRVGVIGLGSIAQNRHLKEYATCADVQVVAVADPDAQKCDETTQRFSGAKAYAEFGQLIREANVDAISICAPNAVHAPAAIAALERGIHVLCEKPMATSLAEAKAMLGAADASGAFLMMAHNQRFDAVHRTAREILRTGRLGPLVAFRSFFGTPGPDRWLPEGLQSWFFRDQPLAGALADLGAHKADLIPWLANSPATRVSAFLAGGHKGEQSHVNDNAALVLQLASGALGTIQASWTHAPGVENATVLYCERGKIRILDDPTCELVVESAAGREELRVGRPSSPANPIPSGLIEHFVAAIRSGQAPAVTGQDGLAALRILLAAADSARSGQAVDL